MFVDFNYENIYTENDDIGLHVNVVQLAISSGSSFLKNCIHAERREH